MINGHSPSSAATSRGSFALEFLETRKLLSGGHFHGGPGGMRFDGHTAPDVRVSYAQGEARLEQHEFTAGQQNTFAPERVQYKPAFSDVAPAAEMTFVRVEFVEVSSNGFRGFQDHDAPAGMMGAPRMPHVEHGDGSFGRGFEVAAPAYPLPVNPGGIDALGNGSTPVTGAQPGPTFSVQKLSSDAGAPAHRVVPVIKPAMVPAANQPAPLARTREILASDIASVASVGAKVIASSIPTATFKLAGLLPKLPAANVGAVVSTGQQDLPQETTAVAAAAVSSPIVKALRSMGAASRSYSIAHLPNPLMLLNDSLSNFADEAAATSTKVIKSASGEHAALVTVAVIAADVAILTYARKSRPKRRVSFSYAMDEQFIKGRR